MEEMKLKPEERAEVASNAEATHNTPVLEVVEGGVESSNGVAADSAAHSQPQPFPPMDWKRFGAPVAVLMTLMVALVLAVQFLPRPEPVKDAETLHKVPATLGEWSLLQEYEVSPSALNELKPDEYLARIYVNSQGDQADLSIIGGSHTGAFHNPQVCFRVQNWLFAETSNIELQVPGREEPIPATFVRLVHADDRNRQAVGIYFYSTPMGYRSDTSTARVFLLLARLAGVEHQRAYFVRFLKTSSGDPERDRAEIKQFAEQAIAVMRQTNPEVIR